jgi:hypothetical protein
MRRIKCVTRPARAEVDWTLYDSSWAGVMVFMVISIVFPNKIYGFWD